LRVPRMACPEQNLLLAKLPANDRARLLPDLEHVHLKLRQPVYESGKEQSHVYFPTDSVISLLDTTEEGWSTEIAVVGNDGLLGVVLLMGGRTTPSIAVVQSAGDAYRLPASVIRREFQRSGQPLQQLLLRYTQALLPQMAQTAVCNPHHTIDQQFCRWLLLILDRLPSNRITMTQDLIANTLGVRRVGVSEAASKLQAANYIRYVRDEITVLDRKALERLVCGRKEGNGSPQADGA